MNGVVKKLEQIGISPDETLVYLYLIKHGRGSAIDISKGSGILRTKVYRLLEKLISKGLVIEVAKENGVGRYFQAADIVNLEDLIKKRELELKNIRDDFASTYIELKNLGGEGFIEPKVVKYNGVDGLSQIMWNSSKAVGALRLYEIQSLDAYLDYGFYEEIRIEHVNRNIKYINLTNATEVKAYTNIARFVNECVQVRHIPKEKLSLNFEFIIYNDVYAMYGIDNDGELFGVEIRDQKLADMQSDIFDYIWSKSEEMTIFDDFGSAKLTKNTDG